MLAIEMARYVAFECLSIFCGESKIFLDCIQAVMSGMFIIKMMYASMFMHCFDTLAHWLFNQYTDP